MRLGGSEENAQNAAELARIAAIFASLAHGILGAETT